MACLRWPPGIWQARGYDISNITFIAGKHRLGDH
jgi:alkyl sulfatase BDS1-like metallo-beta-lactamase superfamily hydrolase